MALTKLNTHGIGVDVILAEDIAANAVTVSEIQDNAVTLAKMASGTDGNIISYDASGDPAFVATGNDGQVLTSTGAGSPPAFEDAAAGGPTNIDLWRITGNVGLGGSSITLSPNSYNLARVTGSGYEVFASLGTAMTCDASTGIFTFPATGLWRIDTSFHFYSTLDIYYIQSQASATDDNFTTQQSLCFGQTFLRTNGNTFYTSCTATGIFDVTNTSTHQVKFQIWSSPSQPYLFGANNAVYSYIMFTRLGDT
mgnify:CR=1 FL=1